MFERTKAVLSPLRPLFDGWMLIVRGFSWLLARVFAVALFFTGFLGYGIVMRLVGFDPLHRTIDEDRETYWGETVTNCTNIEEFKKQY